MAKRTNEEREHDRDREAAVLADILKTRTADEWEIFFQARHVPAARVRTLAEAVRDPQFATRGVTHHHAAAGGIDGSFDVPLAAFKFAHGGPSIETPPRELGADTDAVLAEHGYDADQIAEFRRVRVI
jgi:crotonobetainyl-CoA:carnitine CoA-transferase CaiB-like acyl-CoA transferase